MLARKRNIYMATLVSNIVSSETEFSSLFLNAVFQQKISVNFQSTLIASIFANLGDKFVVIEARR